MSKNLLEIKDVTFAYGKQAVIKDIKLEVTKGDFLGLIGPNGSGKSTLLKLILGLLPLQKGKITLLGKEIRHFKEWDAIGYVPQKAASITEQFPASVEEIVATGLLAKKRPPRRFTKEDQKKVRNALKQVNITALAQERIGELSGGQQQRALIARALITNPKLLILDEPTTGVDQESQERFYQLLHALNKKGITIIIVSHDLHRITSYVTKVASINKTITFYGSHEEFCKHPEEDSDHHCLDLEKEVHHHHH